MNKHLLMTNNSPYQTRHKNPTPLFHNTFPLLLLSPISVYILQDNCNNKIFKGMQENNYFLEEGGRKNFYFKVRVKGKRRWTKLSSLSQCSQSLFAVL